MYHDDTTRLLRSTRGSRRLMRYIFIFGVGLITGVAHNGIQQPKVDSRFNEGLLGQKKIFDETSRRDNKWNLNTTLWVRRSGSDDQCVAASKEQNVVIAQFVNHRTDSSKLIVEDNARRALSYAQSWGLDFVAVPMLTDETILTNRPIQTLFSSLFNESRSSVDVVLALHPSAWINRLDVDSSFLLSSPGWVGGETEDDSTPLAVVLPVHHPSISVLLSEPDNSAEWDSFVHSLGIQRDLGSPFITKMKKDDAIDRTGIVSNIHTPACALLFFGVPKQFKNIVYPSVKRFVLDQNPTCDIFAHTYNISVVSNERNGESNETLDVGEISLLWNSTSLSRKNLMIESVDQVVSQYNLTEWRLLHPQGPCCTNFDIPTTFDNLLKQWHSIQSVFQLMERQGAVNGVKYIRVGLFRSDVFFVNPINIFRNMREDGSGPGVITLFSSIPTNERMFYGHVDDARIFATKRWASIPTALREGHFKKHKGLHMETYLSTTILPQMAEKYTKDDVCFMRVRANGSIKRNDCHHCFRNYHGSPARIGKVDLCPSARNKNLTHLVSCVTGLICSASGAGIECRK